VDIDSGGRKGSKKGSAGHQVNICRFDVSPKCVRACVRACVCVCECVCVRVCVCVCARVCIS
jgi:hypothetical protein